MLIFLGLLIALPVALFVIGWIAALLKELFPAKEYKATQERQAWFIDW